MSNISFFSNTTQTTPAKSISIKDFLTGVKEGTWAEQVVRVREADDKEVKKTLKKSCPSVTISGTFSYRKESDLIAHSGFICIDIDTEVDFNRLRLDPYTYSTFKSIGGTGAAVVVKINPEKHSDSFEWLKQYYYEHHNITIDSAPRNVASMRYVSYDPDLFLNEKSKVCKHKISSPPKYKPSTIFYSSDETSQLIAQIVNRRIDIAPTYHDYCYLSFSLASEFKESGRQYFHDLCSINPKYKVKDADKQYDNALRDVPKNKKPVTINTLYYMARQHGVEITRPDNSPANIAILGKKQGLTNSQIAEHIVSETDLPVQKAEEIASAVKNRPDLSVQNIASDPEALIQSLVLFIKSKYKLRKNLITQKIEFTKNHEPLQEEDLNDIYLAARGTFNTPNVTKDLVNTIIFSNCTPTYHPIQEYINKNIDLCPQGRIDELISCIETDTPNAGLFIRKWLIGIQAAIDGHPVRLMLVFTGPQYNGKTEFFRRLLPKSLKSFYAESKLDRGKDDELLMCQKLIVMDDEMGGKSKQDEKRLKELTSKEFFSLRAPYRRDNMDYKRLAILCGTSNPTEIITDPTGNTRILPVEVKSIDFDRINAISRKELFMECYHAYKSGEPYQLSRDEVNVLADTSADFSTISFELELISKHFSAPSPTSSYAAYMTATEIKDHIETNSKQQIKNITKFGIELRKVFGKPHSQKRNGFPVKCYKVIRLSGDQPPQSPYNKSDEPPF